MQDIYRKSLGVNYNVASAIGSEAIPMAVSLIPEVGQPLGIALSSLSDAGNAKATAYQNGITGWNAYLYAGIRGVTSAVITKSFAAIPGLSDNASTTFKGIIKGSVQARTFCCCSAKIDLFTLKVLSGEEINLDEFFDIEKDAETFSTALCTAFILNGGKALTIKIKGKKTTVTAEAVEKCIDKDGNLDVEKLINNISPKSSLIEDYKSGKISLYGMADSDIDSAIQQKIYNRGWYSDTDYIYQYQYELTGSYGCDQGGIASLIKYKLADGTLIDSRNGKYYANSEKTASQEYHDIKNYLVKKYNMSAKDASSLLTGLDSIGACSYASTINSLISFYSTRPDEFEATFGYPLYKK